MSSRHSFGDKRRPLVPVVQALISSASSRSRLSGRKARTPKRCGPPSSAIRSKAPSVSMRNGSTRPVTTIEAADQPQFLLGCGRGNSHFLRFSRRRVASMEHRPQQRGSGFARSPRWLAFVRLRLRTPSRKSHSRRLGRGIRRAFGVVLSHRNANALERSLWAYRSANR